MAVKYWSFAGLTLTYRCSARCRSCYVGSSPESAGEMSVELGLATWQGLQQASPHGCRIHIGGGEPFLCWEKLIDLARRAQSLGLGPLQAVETNAYWACDEPVIRDRLAQLDQAGMQRLHISCDPFHQEFVPMANVRRLSQLAAEILGSERVCVRWRDWQERGFDLSERDEPARLAVIDEYLRHRRERLNGRAASELASRLPLKNESAFADQPCAESLLRSRHVHADGLGLLSPGTCAGIVLGRIATAGDVPAAWQDLSKNWADMPVVGPLAQAGPLKLAETAARTGYRFREQGYATKCHLCWDVRQWLWHGRHFADQLGPAGVYESHG